MGSANTEGDSNGIKDRLLDAGALFVLESKGTWIHAGFHLTTSIVAPALLSLPFSFASLGWVAGVICLTIGAVVTFYSYNLLSLVLEHLELQGNRQMRFRDVSYHVMGPMWAKFLVGPIQFIVCYGSVIGCTLLGGQTLKFIYIIYHPDGEMKLYEFIVCFGGLMLILAQMPSFHSLRHINLVSFVLCLAYSTCAVIGCIETGYSEEDSEKDYSLVGSTKSKLFAALNSFSIIATTFGNGIIPEIQATLAPPVSGKMFKALSICYAVVVSTFSSVAISGYWAFGNKADGTIFNNFVPSEGPLFLPKWFLLMANMFVLLQGSAVGMVYLQPAFEVLERKSADVRQGRFSLRNLIPRLILRTLAVAIAILLAAMLPFFGDVNAVIGAFGFLPLDFVLPMVCYNLTFRPSKRGIIFWINAIIAVAFSIMTVLGSVAAIRQIFLDAKNYKLFANI
ncbi:GABA transporter 1 isoform X2 [Cryptomeria japonica]|uniref:GABA transporter 1 isoform X2 n=1 Tax=Cryptomeria japonica TaxID=3369 RepID=UPI0025ACFEC9|nr:GABA transporter 1 isoform X2 [Cryptomeria japonica]